MRPFLPLLLAGTLAAASASSNALAIVTRHDVEDTAYLADEGRVAGLFALYRSKAGHRDCIATPFDLQWAITARHCTLDQPFLDGMKNGDFSVTIGGKPLKIDRVVRYPADEDGAEHDLALLHLSEPIAAELTIPLYRATDELGRTVLLPGWGGKGDGLDGLGTPDGRLRIAENRIDAVSERWLIWKFDDPRSSIPRALALEGISGPGDSGGPALIATSTGWAIAGVSSGQKTFGRAEGLYNAEEFYVRLSQYADWIDRTVAKP